MVLLLLFPEQRLARRPRTVSSKFSGMPGEIDSGRLELGKRGQLRLAPIHGFRAVVLRRLTEGALRRLICELRDWL